MTGGWFHSPRLFPLIGLPVGVRLAIKQGVAWGSRQDLRVTLIWWLHKRDRDDVGGQAWGWGGEPLVFLTPGDGNWETRRRQGRLDLGTVSCLELLIDALGSEKWRGQRLEKGVGSSAWTSEPWLPCSVV